MKPSVSGLAFISTRLVTRPPRLHSSEICATHGESEYAKLVYAKTRKESVPCAKCGYQIGNK